MKKVLLFIPAVLAAVACLSLAFLVDGNTIGELPYAIAFITLVLYLWYFAEELSSKKLKATSLCCLGLYGAVAVACAIFPSALKAIFCGHAVILLTVMVVSTHLTIKEIQMG